MPYDTTDLIDRIDDATTAWTRIRGLDMGGRTGLLMVASHMAEVTKLVQGDFADVSEAATAYFHRFYDDHVRELVQSDDVAFTTHHYLRILYEHYSEEVEAIAKGPLGAALSRHDLSWPDVRPPTPARGRAIAGYWYDDVKHALAAGRLPEPHAATQNTMMTPEECVTDDVKNELLWLSALKWLITIWGEQSIPMWAVLRDTIDIRRTAGEIGEDDIEAAVAADRDALAGALARYAEAFERWRDFHAETLSIHFPLFRLYLVGFEDWVVSFGEPAGAIPILENLKDEVYLEVATTVASLRGEPYDVEVGPQRYWRQAPWTAPAQVPGAPGMPPFGG